MAYAVKYLFKFQSSNGTVREIRVLQDGYSGDVIQRPLGRAPVIKKEQNGGVHGTSLTFYAECHVDQEYIEFYTSDPKEYRVDVYAGSTLLWQGYITPELYSEPDIAPPYDVQVVATDGVGELKLYDFTPQGTVTLRSLLAYLLGYTGLSTDVNLISSLKPGSHGAGALLDMQICIDYLAGKTCYEALTYLLDTLHATVTRWGGAWLLVRETNVTFTGDKVRYFNTSGNSALLAGSVQTLGAMRSAPAWPVGQLSTVIDPAKNKVVVQAPWHPVSGLVNSGMTSDTGWTKAGGAEYDATNVGYHFPAASLSALPRISQEIAMSGLRMPFRMSGRFTGVSADLSLNTLFTAGIGFYVTYTTNSATYHLERSDEGIVWKQGAMPGLLGFDDTLSTFLQNFDEDRTAGREIGFTVPPFVQGSAFPAGTLKIYIIGNCARIYTASLDVEVSKGYQDILHIDNGARGEGDEVEIAIGRQTADVAYYQSFLQGLLLDSGSLITGFTDANFTTAMDYLALISRDYALSAALPRALAKGTVYLESSIGMPPLVFAKGGLNYWLETWSWDLYEDELEISARTLPSASLTVQSETILESDGSTVSSGSSGSSDGGSSINPGGGINYFEQDDDQQELIKLKAVYSYLGPKKGLIFDSVLENDTSDADLYVKWVGEGTNRQRVLYSPLALITGGDQIIGSGTPGGGGGGGAGYLYELGDIYHDANKTKVLRTDGTTPAAVGDVLQLTSLTGGNKWAAVPASSIGGVTSVVGQTGDVTASQIVTAIGLGNYLPLSAGSGKALTGILYSVGIINNGDTSYAIRTRGLEGAETDGTQGDLYINYRHSGNVYINGGTNSGSVAIGIDGYSGTAKLYVAGTGADILALNRTSGSYTWIDFLLEGTHKGYLGFGSDGKAYVYTGSVNEIYHSGNANNSSTPWSASNLTSYTWARCTYMHFWNTAITDYAGYCGRGSSQNNSIQLWGYAGNAVAIGAGNAERIRVTSDGYVGIWNQQPSLVFQVNGTVASSWVSKITGAKSDVWLAHADGYGLAVNSTVNSSSVYLMKLVYNQSTLDSGGTMAFYVRGDGNVGIGTDSPSRPLDVNGTARCNYMRFRNAAGTGDSGYVGRAASSADYMYIWNEANADMYFGTNNTTRMTITSSGNVGIGIATPAYSLDVAGYAAFGTSSGCYIYLKRPNANYISASATGGFFIWLVNGSSTQAMRLNTSGNLTVGTTTTESDGYKLYVNGPGYYNGILYTNQLINLGATSAAIRTRGLDGANTDGTQGDLYVNQNHNGAVYINNNYSGNAYLCNGGGNVGIGTNNASHRLDVRGNARCNYMYWYHNAGQANAGYFGCGTSRYVVQLAISSGWNLEVAINNQVSTWSTTGLTLAGILTSTGDQVISSDINLKTNLQDVTYSVEDIAKTRAVTFDWKDGRGKSAGSIAQDWKPLIPELVHGEEGNMTLAYGQIALVNTILLAKHETEQDKEIKALKNRVKELENEVKRLRS